MRQHAPESDLYCSAPFFLLESAHLRDRVAVQRNQPGPVREEAQDQLRLGLEKALPGHGTPEVLTTDGERHAKDKVTGQRKKTTTNSPWYPKPHRGADTRVGQLKVKQGEQAQPQAKNKAKEGKTRLDHRERKKTTTNSPWYPKPHRGADTMVGQLKVKRGEQLQPRAKNKAKKPWEKWSHMWWISSSVRITATETVGSKVGKTRPNYKKKGDH